MLMRALLPLGGGGGIKILGCEAQDRLGAHTQPLLFPCRRFALPLRYPRDWRGVEPGEKKTQNQIQISVLFSEGGMERQALGYSLGRAKCRHGNGVRDEPSSQAMDGAQSCQDGDGPLFAGHDLGCPHRRRQQDRVRAISPAPWPSAGLAVAAIKSGRLAQPQDRSAPAPDGPGCHMDVKCQLLAPDSQP